MQLVLATLEALAGDLAARRATDQEISEIAVEPGTDPMLAVIEMQRIAINAINKIGGSPDEPPPKHGLMVVK